VAARWRDPSAFRADPAAAPAARPSRTQAVALLAVLAVVAAGVALVSYLIKPEKARAFDLFHGSLFLADQNNTPVGIDLTSGKPTIRLTGAGAEVGIATGQSLGVVPLVDATLLLNESTGEFNMVASTGDVVKRLGGGVPLAKRSGGTTAMGVATDDGQAYIVRTGATGGTDVFLVSQPTVESAIGATSGVKPRASTSMPDATSTAAGGAVSANDDLWLLAGPAGGRQTVRQLTVPANSSAGARLRTHDHGTITGAAALAVATPGAEAPGSNGPQIVGVASADRIQVYAPGTTQPITVRFRSPAGVDEVLPASNGQDRLAFLLHSPSGWSLVSVGTDGTGLRGPTALTKVPGTARLAQPAQSRGNLYTLDADTGQIFRIGMDGLVSAVDGAASYPRISVDGRVVEPADFSDAYVVARGPRVVFNSPTHADALMLFTDSSHPPLRIEKSSAVDVSAQGGAEALARSTINPNQVPSKNTGPAKPNAVAPVNNKIDCKVAKQKPHIPVLNPPVPGSRSVALSWSYTVLSSQDCYPSTYVLSFKLISNNAPTPPGTVTVQGQTGANVSGLFPSTQYEVWVTAYINGQGTASQPLQFTTGPEGPAAPTNLSVKADNAGNWDISWDGCGTVQQGCVQAQTWTVTPSFCDGRGVASPPAPLTKTADPTSKVQPPAVYQGSDALLGRGLRFQVQGTGTQGQAGTPSAASPCVYSWSPPVLADISLHPAQTNVSSTSPATVTGTLDLGSDPVRAVGGVGATIKFTLTGGGQNESQTVTYNGSDTNLTVSFKNLPLGANYMMGATVNPPQHPGSSVTVPAQQVQVAAIWPTIKVNPSCSTAYLGPIPVGCNLTVTLSGLSSSTALGETFDLTSNSQACSDTSAPVQLSASNFDPSTVQITAQLSYFQFTGSCTISIQLIEHGSPDPGYFGDNPSPIFKQDVSLGGNPTANIPQSDISAAWDSHDGSSVKVQYTGPLSDSDVTQLTQNWKETLRAPASDGGAVCSSAAQNAQPTHAGIYIDVSPASCVQIYGGDPTKQWTIEVSYQNKDGSKGGDFTYTLTGEPPGYLACNATGTLGAAWGASAKSINVTTSAAKSDLAGCSSWGYELTDSTGTQVCPSSTNGLNGAPPTTIDLTSCGAPPAAGWQVIITWNDAAGNPQKDTETLGTPPS
jgi:hypothetical protein